MNDARIYVTDSEGNQKEVSRSKPNANPPTAEYKLPLDQIVTSIKTVAGYGNVDTYITVEQVIPKEPDDKVLKVSGVN